MSGLLAPRVVMLTGSGFVHRCVAARLDALLEPGTLRVIVVGRPTFRRRVASMMRRHGPLGVARRTLQMVLAAVTCRRRRVTHALAKEFGSPGWPPWTTWCPAGLHSSQLLQQVRAEHADLLVLFGVSRAHAPLISDCACLNLHAGIAPYYRGADSVFWALHDNRPWLVGATVHIATLTIDAGPVLMITRPEVTPGDDEHTLYAKCLSAGTTALGHACQHFDTMMPWDQDLSCGREYRSIDRPITSEFGWLSRTRRSQHPRNG